MEIKKKSNGADHDAGGAPPEYRRTLSKARQVTLVGIGGATFRALAVLRGVRMSGEAKRGLQETIAIALQQGAAFKRWSELGTPIRRVQVWVESHLVMTVSPEENTVKLKGFYFDVPSPRDAVMRILKADEGEEPIVLKNLPLNTVPVGGLDDTSELPNGQRIRLVIMPEEMGRYDITVEFVRAEDAIEVAGRPRAKAKTIGARMRGTSSFQPSYVPTLLPQVAFSSGASACALVILGLSLCGIFAVSSFAGRANNNTGFVTNNDSHGRQLPQPDSGTDRKVSNSSDRGWNPEVGGPTAYVLVPVPSQSATVVSDSAESCPASDHHGAIPKKAASNVTSNSDPVKPSPGEAQQETKPALVLGLSDHYGPRVFTSWDAKSFPKLAKVRFVDVRMDKSPAEVHETNSLHQSFLRVLKESSFWEIRDRDTEPKPDAVLNLKFNPDEECLGVVIVNINDSEGNFLLQAFVSCQDLEKQGHAAMFAEASRRLIAKLQDTVKLSEHSAKQAQQQQRAPEAISVAYYREP